MLMELVLGSRDKRDLFALFEEQWAIEIPRELRDEVWIKNNDERIFLCTRAIAALPIDRMRAERAGIYLGAIQRHELRLSVEGSQLFGPLARKNIVDLTREEAFRWLKGEDIVRESDSKAFVLVRHKSDFLGCGKLSEGKLINYVPKERRLRPGADPFIEDESDGTEQPI